MKLILLLFSKVYLNYIYLVYISINNLKIIDVKKLIAYLSVSYTLIYLLEIFSNTIQNIEAGIDSNLAYKLIFSWLFIYAKDVLYYKFLIKLVIYYRNIIQIRSFFSIFYFILYLNNIDISFSFNLIIEFLFLYRIFQKLAIVSALAFFFILLFATYIINMFIKILLLDYFLSFLFLIYLILININFIFYLYLWYL